MRTPAFILIAMALLLAPAISQGADQASCLLCHHGAAGMVEGAAGLIDMRIEVERFRDSVHGGLDCATCHERFADNPHQDPGQMPDRVLVSMKDSPRAAMAMASTAEPDPSVMQIALRIAPKASKDAVAAAACSKCHSEIYEQVLGSVHGKSITTKGSADAALCQDCHGGPHYVLTSSNKLSPAYRDNVVKTCAACHADDEKALANGLNPEVMKSFQESFHGKKLALGHKKAPTCISCHGYHDVRKKDDPSAPVFGTNRLVTCGGCHPGANMGFVGAISHKDPGPIPHYAEKGLILLTLSTFIFIILHVTLEAISDIRDVLGRKPPEVKVAEAQQEVNHE